MAGELPPPGALAPARPSAAAVGEVRALIAQQGDLIDSLDKASMRALLPALVDARNELRQGLLAWLRVAPDGDERYTAQQHRKALLLLQRALDRAAELGHDVEATLVDNGRKAGQLSINNLQEQVARFGEVFGETVTPIDFDTAAALAKGDKLRYKHYRTSAARYAGQVGDDIRHQFAVGVAKNETFSQLKARLVRLGGPSVLVYTRGKAGDPGAIAEQIAEGLFRRHRHWAERLVRTELIGAYNDQHDAGIGLLNEHRDEATTDEYLMRWDASLDKRICPVCRGLDRTVALQAGTFRGGYKRPPAHPNCRCVLVAWHASWGDIAGEIPPHGKATRKPLPAPPATPKRARARAPKKIAAAPPPDPAPLAAAATTYDGGTQLAAAARGKWSDARGALNNDIADHEGYQPSVVATPGHPDRFKVRVRKMPRGVGGMHYSGTGLVAISSERAAAAQRFARDYTADPDGVRARLAGAARALETGAAAAAEDVRTVADAKCYRTLVHEVMHDHGPMRARAYRAEGVLVEEVATEVAARRYLRTRYGMGPELFTEAATGAGMGYNPYGHWVDHVTGGVAQELGIDQTRARAVMERAADRYKRRAAGTVANEDEALGAFAADIAAEAGSHEQNAIRRRLVTTARTRFK